ncbi:MAG: hypothetical protein R3B55_00350 [Candidatus Paceibacterota bacterium]
MIEDIKTKVNNKEDVVSKPHTWTEEEISPLIGNMLILKDTNNLKEDPENYRKKRFGNF